MYSNYGSLSPTQNAKLLLLLLLLFISLAWTFVIIILLHRELCAALRRGTYEIQHLYALKLVDELALGGGREGGEV